MLVCTCKEPQKSGGYDEDELVAIPVGKHWWIVHIPCGRKAEERLDTN